MRSYGHKRTEKQTCKHGCCTRDKGNKHSAQRTVNDRRARKAARRAAKKEIANGWYATQG